MTERDPNLLSRAGTLAHLALRARKQAKLEKWALIFGLLAFAFMMCTVPLLGSDDWRKMLGTLLLLHMFGLGCADSYFDSRDSGLRASNLTRDYCDALAEWSGYPPERIRTDARTLNLIAGLRSYRLDREVAAL